MKQTDFPSLKVLGFWVSDASFKESNLGGRVSEEAVQSGGRAEAPIISFIYGGRKKSQPPAASPISYY